jgi:beta-glucosidase
MTRFHLLQNRTARRRLAAVAVLAVAISLLAGGGALAARHAGQPSAPPVDSRVNALLAKMTLQEKLEQIQLLPDFMVTDQEVKNGLGSVLSVTDPATINRLQHIAVDQSRLHIPLLFAFDTIHGFRTIFPIPLGSAGSDGRRHDRRPRVGRGRAQAGVRPDGGRLARAAVGAHR